MHYELCIEKLTTIHCEPLHMHAQAASHLPGRCEPPCNYIVAKRHRAECDILHNRRQAPGAARSLRKGHTTTIAPGGRHNSPEGRHLIQQKSQETPLRRLDFDTLSFIFQLKLKLVNC